MELEAKAARIKLLVLDVDGVMTDGRIVINHLGEEIKSFDSKDGHGISMLIKAGIDVAIISGRKSRAVEVRAEALGIKDIHLGVIDKEPVMLWLISEKGLKQEEICCMGDDLPDIPMFHHAGISVAVSDAVTEVCQSADMITKNRGGKGAVREVCEMILKAQGKWSHNGFINAGAGK
ncbi:MAG: HAD hydrolase family protein [Deltaproteobacteria bacterium]|nr:HAD hydrolase family protein [Deltaproteobacteria bacterium]